MKKISAKNLGTYGGGLKTGGLKTGGLTTGRIQGASGLVTGGLAQPGINQNAAKNAPRPPRPRPQPQPKPPGPVGNNPQVPDPTFPAAFGGIMPWGGGLGAFSRLYLPKQPKATRLASVYFTWSIAPADSLTALIFSVLWIDGANNIYSRVSHDVLAHDFPLLHEEANAIVNSGDMFYPSVDPYEGTMTFGMSLVPINTPLDLNFESGDINMDEIVSEHPLPWHVTTTPTEQVAVEVTAITGGAVTLVIPQVAYRFSAF